MSRGERIFYVWGVGASLIVVCLNVFEVALVPGLSALGAFSAVMLSIWLFL